MALAAAMEAVEHLKLELQDVHSRLEVVLDERVAGDALLKTEQGRGGWLATFVNSVSVLPLPFSPRVSFRLEGGDIIG